MPRPYRIASVVLAGVILLPHLTNTADLPPASAAVVDEVSRPAPPKDGTRVTLITGDRVLLTSRTGALDQVLFEPGPGSSSTSAVITRAGGHTVVIPSAAMSEVASGKLDRDLFDVTTLIAEGRDDARSPGVPVIIEYDGLSYSSLQPALGELIPGGTTTRVLTSVGARAATVRKASARTFWLGLASSRVGVKRITLDRKVSVSLDKTVPQIGAPAAWKRGFTGKGVKVAVLDTGIDSSHPDFAGRLAEVRNFSSAETGEDKVGHGTHVAGILAGNGAASNGKYRGVAPEASLLIGKVLDDEGSGSESAIIAGMEWAVARGAKVVNLSLASADPSDGTDPMSQAINRLSRKHDTLFIVAAGNCYVNEDSQTPGPAAADEAVAVGNLQINGASNDSSCRGPRTSDGVIKPEISAPGTGVVAPRAAGTSEGTPVNERYTSLTGTSMAAPHVAGAAVLLSQANPSWRGRQLKARLLSTSDPQRGSGIIRQGAGRVDADQATTPGVSVDSGELLLGMVHWPYPTSDSIKRTLVYRNPGATPVTLRLKADLGAKLSQAALVIPPRGQSTLTMTVDRRKLGIGSHSGRVTATPVAGGDPLVTLFGWYNEPERYDLNMRGYNLDGTPATSDLAVNGGAAPSSVRMENGKAVLRVPPGRYDVAAVFGRDATDTRVEDFALASTEVLVRRATTVILDARKAVPVDAVVAKRPGLAARERGMTYLRGNSWAVGALTIGTPRRFFATPTPRRTGRTEFSTGVRWEVPPYRAVRSDGGALPVTDYFFGPRFTGTKELRVVPSNPGGFSGGLAVVARTRAKTVGEQALAAENAGAAAVLFYDPARPGIDADGPFFAPEGARIPVLRTSRAAARDLLAAMHLQAITVRITGTAATPYVYDLVVPWAGRIPADASEVVQAQDLARLDETFGSHTDGVLHSETRSGLTPAGTSYGSWLMPAFVAPHRRTSFLSGNSTRWSDYLVVNNSGTGDPFGLRSVDRTYRAGVRSLARWVMPVATSGLPAGGEGPARVVRRGTSLLIALSPFGHGPSQYAEPFDGSGQYDLKVWRDDAPVGEVASAFMDFDVPAGPGHYRIDLDARRDLPWWRYSTRVVSSWSFRSTSAPTEVLPLLVADLDLPQAGPLSAVAAGRPVRITLGLRHQTGAPASRITSARLQLSYDGESWHTLPLKAYAPGRYVATVVHPAAKAGVAPSLRVEATDAAGGRLHQEITKAYSLRH